MLSSIKPKTPSPSFQPQTEGLEGQLPLQTPHNILEPDAQARALQEYRTRVLHDQTSPTDQAINNLVKGCQLAIHKIVLLADNVKRLRTKKGRQKRKKDMRRSYIAHGGILTVAQGLQLAEERAKAKEGSGMGSNVTKRLCSVCRLPGHNRRRCPKIQ